MSGEFLDSNIFVYLFDNRDRDRRRIAEALVTRALVGGTACISFQVVQETLNVLTRKLAKPATHDDARRFLDQILERFTHASHTANTSPRRKQGSWSPAHAQSCSDPCAMRSRTALMPLWRVMPSQALYQRSLEVRTRYRFSFYDSLIIAAALEAGCATLYTEDLQHGQKIEGLTIENPFANRP